MITYLCALASVALFLLVLWVERVQKLPVRWVAEVCVHSPWHGRIYEAGRSRWLWMARLKAKWAASGANDSMPRSDGWEEIGIDWRVREVTDSLPEST